MVKIPAKKESSGRVKKTLDLPEDLVSGLKELAEINSSSFSHEMSEAIGMLLFCKKLIENGNSLLIEKQDSRIIEIVFL